MINSGHIERLFRNETITFDPKELRIVSDERLLKRGVKLVVHFR